MHYIIVFGRSTAHLCAAIILALKVKGQGQISPSLFDPQNQLRYISMWNCIKSDQLCSGYRKFL